jgi:hypothetical protein
MKYDFGMWVESSFSPFFGASGILPSALQPFKAYFANLTLVPPFISRGSSHQMV